MTYQLWEESNLWLRSECPSPPQPSPALLIPQLIPTAPPLYFLYPRQVINNFLDGEQSTAGKEGQPTERAGGQDVSPLGKPIQ